jgi:hypothetical protein
MGDYVVSWTGDVTVTLAGVAVENGAVVTLGNPRLGQNNVVITAADNSVDCTVVMTIAEYKEPATVLVVGENAVVVTVENYYCAGKEVEFTAPKAGTYVISAAEGETNADVGVLDEYGIEWVSLPYEVEMAEGETLGLVICTTAYMTLTEDEINLVIAEKVEVPEDSTTDSESSDDVSSDNSESSDDVSSESSSTTDSESSEVESEEEVAFGCFGSVSGPGVAALGLAAVALFKKKED